MSTRYAHIAFSPAAVERQRSTGSFTVYGSKLDQPTRARWNSISARRDS